MKPEDMVSLRARHGWDQREFGFQIGRSLQAIKNYERGIERIPLVVALACAAVDAGIRRDAVTAAA